jgi:hypothetical protein
MIIEVGNLVEVSYRETEEQEGFWEYGVITDVFDDRTCVLTEGGRRIMNHNKSEEGNYSLDNSFFDDDTSLAILTRDGKPIKVKKSLFGKYKFPKREG